MEDPGSSSEPLLPTPYWGKTRTAPPEADHFSQFGALLPPPRWGLDIGKVFI